MLLNWKFELFSNALLFLETWSIPSYFVEWIMMLKALDFLRQKCSSIFFKQFFYLLFRLWIKFFIIRCCFVALMIDEQREIYKVSLYARNVLCLGGWCLVFVSVTNLRKIFNHRLVHTHREKSLQNARSSLPSPLLGGCVIIFVGCRFKY